MFGYTAEPGSKFQEPLNLLACWAATRGQAEPVHATEELDPRRHLASAASRWQSSLSESPPVVLSRLLT
jgi:hypothetical protein